jgi:hypothetical protein
MTVTPFWKKGTKKQLHYEVYHEAVDDGGSGDGCLDRKGGGPRGKFDSFTLCHDRLKTF